MLGLNNNTNKYSNGGGHFSKIKKKRGFTLIELLAVIIILGVLMIIAIPAVTEYISSSRKNAYVTTATRYIDGVRNMVNSAKLPFYDKEVTYYVPGSCVSMEKGGDSPFGDWVSYYVAVTYDGSSYDYYWTSRDKTNTGIYLTYQDLLNIDSVKSGVTDITPDIGVGDREKILVLKDTCNINDVDELVATSNIPEKGASDGASSGGSGLVGEITKDGIPLDNVASTYVTSSTGINFGSAPSDTNGKGLYIKSGTENNTNPIYYYRGAVDNNNVIFGEFCWKIVRTTESGGIKLIYNGAPTDGVCNNTGTASQIKTSVFNLNYSSPADVGYMYGTRYTYSSKSAANITAGMVFGNDVTYSNGTYTLTDTYTSANGWATDYSTIGSKYHYTCFTTGTTCSTVYYIYYPGSSSSAYYMTLTGGKKINDILKEMTTESTNENDSTIKTNIDTWYKDNMTEYTSYLEDAIWCNDRSISTLGGWDKDTSASSILYFGASGRNTNSPYKPSLDCPSKNYSFTVGSSGNGKLTYPVGLLTADEATLAGHGWSGYSSSSYLYTGQYWWLLSPSYFYFERAFGFYVSSSGYLASPGVDFAYGLRPAVSLKPGTKFSSGDGTVNSPYIVE